VTATIDRDQFDLGRFLDAQEACFARVLGELAAGEKVSHWMWFIFPQLRGLGSSPTARRFGIGSLAEARAYLAHPVLGERLRECTRLVNGVAGRTAEAIFGHPDNLKFRSSLTLFAHAAADSSAAEDRVFGEALARYYGGEPDPLTLKLLSPASTSAS
jgi:uncharacterized protein (DUF1810 family)